MSANGPPVAMQKHRSSPPSSSTAFGATFWTSLAEEVVITLAHSVILFTGLGITLYAIDPTRAKNSSAKKHREKVRQKMIANGRVPFDMTDYEAIIALDLVYPVDIQTGFGDVGGLEEIKREIWDLVCLPLQRLDLFGGKSELIRPPKGILLFGPPGTGKTMMAKAIAKESDAAFINLKVSTLLDKWFGESEKLVRATFTLAWKLSPCVIFIDEIESFLKKRGQSHEHQSISNMKAEFMSLWDGLNANLFTEAGLSTSASSANFLTRMADHLASMLLPKSRRVRAKEVSLKEQQLRRKLFGVVVIGATNRPGDIDDAVLRRMARTFCLDLPSKEQRFKILSLILKNEELSADLRQKLPVLSENLEGFSGSDLKELCRAAAVIPLQEMAEKMRQINREKQGKERSEGESCEPEPLSIRKLQASDFREARKKIFATGFAARQYQHHLEQKEAGQQPNTDFFQALATAFANAQARKPTS